MVHKAGIRFFKVMLSCLQLLHFRWAICHFVALAYLHVNLFGIGPHRLKDSLSCLVKARKKILVSHHLKFLKPCGLAAFLFVIFRDILSIFRSLLLFFYTSGKAKTGAMFRIQTTLSE